MTNLATIPYVRSPEEVFGVHVLHVSDNNEILAGLRSVFQSTSWRLTEVPALRDVRAVLKKDDAAISVVVCDLTLRSNSWLDVMTTVRGSLAPPAFVVAVEYADLDAWKIALRSGADDVVPTPYEHQETLYTISCNHLMKRQGRSKNRSFRDVGHC